MPSAKPNRLYVGNISRDTNERDIREEFERHGRLQDILMKSNYAFVEFEKNADAMDALKNLNGVEIHGRRWSVEETRKPPKAERSRSRDRYRSRRDRDRRYRSRSRGRRYDRRDRRSYDRYDRRRRDRSYDRGHRRRDRMTSRLARGDYAIQILGISKTTSWQDLKDWARKAGSSVVFGDIVRENNRTYGLIEYKYREDYDNALETLHQTELHSKTVYVYEKGKAPSVTPSASPKRRSESGSMSKSRSRSSRRSKSKSKSRSMSRSKSKSKSRSPSRSKSPTEIDVVKSEEPKEAEEEDKQMEEEEREEVRSEEGEVEPEKTKEEPEGDPKYMSDEEANDS